MVDLDEVIPGVREGCLEDLRRAEPVAGVLWEIHAGRRRATPVDHAAADGVLVHCHRPAVEMAVVEGGRLRTGGGTDQVGYVHLVQCAGEIHPDIVVGRGKEIDALGQVRGYPLSAGHLGIDAVYRVHVKVAEDKAVGGNHLGELRVHPGRLPGADRNELPENRIARAARHYHLVIPRFERQWLTDAIAINKLHQRHPVGQLVTVITKHTGQFALPGTGIEAQHLQLGGARAGTTGELRGHHTDLEVTGRRQGEVLFHRLVLYHRY